MLLYYFFNYAKNQKNTPRSVPVGFFTAKGYSIIYLGKTKDKGYS